MLNNIVSLLGNGATAAAASFESIATITVGAGGAATVTFTGIPSTYKHLQIRSNVTSPSASNSGTMLVGNGSVDTANNYATHYLFGNGSTVIAGAASTVNYIYTVGASNSSTIASGNITDILDYSNTSKYKTVRTLYGVDRNGSGDMILSSGLWQSTSAINTILFSCNAGNFGQYSSFALYGVKG